MQSTHNQNNLENTYWRTTEYVGAADLGISRNAETQTVFVQQNAANADHKVQHTALLQTQFQKSVRALNVLQLDHTASIHIPFMPKILL